MPHIHFVTVSDRVHAGRAADTAGPRALELAEEHLPGWTANGSVVPDGVESVRSGVTGARDRGADVVVTLGGTRSSPRDLTPEAMDGVISTELPGVAEMLRREGAAQTASAALGRGRAGIMDRRIDDAGPADDASAPERAGGSLTNGAGTAAPRPAVVVNLPGSLRAAEQGVSLIAPLLGHLIEQIHGGGDHARH